MAKERPEAAPENSEERLRRILRESLTIAVYGMSRNPEAPAQEVPLYLAAQGYRIIPINPHVEAIAGLKAYASLSAVPERIDLLNVFRPAPEVPAVVAQALERRAQRGDIDAIWLQRGIVSAEGKALAEAAGISVVQDRCLMVEYRRLIGDRAKS